MEVCVKMELLVLSMYYFVSIAQTQSFAEKKQECKILELPQVIFIPQLQAAVHLWQLEDDSERFVRALD